MVQYSADDGTDAEGGQRARLSGGAIASLTGVRPLALFDPERARAVYPLAYEQGVLWGERIAQIRTDLDPFTDAEQRILENHGYCVTEHRVREKAPHLLPQEPAPATPPHPDWMDEAKARAALRDSHKRISIRRLRGRA